ITGGEAALPGKRAVADELRGMLRSEHVATRMPGKISFPKEFKRLSDRSDRFGGQFWRYLHDRGYRTQHIQWLADSYDLRYAVRGDFAYRLIVPITDRYGKLLSWTGRTIIPNEEKRYDTVRVWRPNLKNP